MTVGLCSAAEGGSTSEFDCFHHLSLFRIMWSLLRVDVPPLCDISSDLLQRGVTGLVTISYLISWSNF